MAVSIRCPDDVPDGTPMAVSLRSTSELATGSWRTFRPEYLTRPAPCSLDCPAGTDVRGFLRLAMEGDAVGAWQTILAHNPLPGVCGRVCYHPCEVGCNRAALDDRIAIHAVERAVAAEAMRQGAEQPFIDGSDQLAGHIAVLGAGPAGLSCAYQLARRGRSVVVFDGADEPGGMLRYGIPAYRLPREVLDEEIGLLRKLSVEFRMGARLGRSLGWSDLRPYDAVFLAVGAQRPRAVRISGEELVGVRPAIDFLREVNVGGAATVKGDVVVIGGGNTAIDAARVALRQGASATVVYRRSRAEMPGHPDEIAQAEREGVQFVFNAAPAMFAGRGGLLAALRCQRTRPGPPDASGRRRPEPIPGDMFSLECVHALTATGEELDTSALDAAVEIADGRLRADRWGRTAKAPLFAGGDAATGAGTVVDAIGSGRRAAEAIDAWLDGAALWDTTPVGRVAVDHLNLFYFGRAVRPVLPMLPPAKAMRSFDEVVGGLSWPAAVAEAGRCLACGMCTECSNCVVFCPDAAVHRKGPGQGFEIDYPHCKGCGLCVTECPRGAMALVAEEER